MATEELVGAVSELPPRKVIGVGPWAVGNSKGDYFAVTQRCRHLYADLAAGTIDSKGCLVCPWHGARYEVKTGRMVLGPQGTFAKIPGLGEVFKLLTSVLHRHEPQVWQWPDRWLALNAPRNYVGSTDPRQGVRLWASYRSAGGSFEREVRAAGNLAKIAFSVSGD